MMFDELKVVDDVGQYAFHQELRNYTLISRHAFTEYHSCSVRILFDQ